MKNFFKINRALVAKKKIFTLFAACLATVALIAAERTVWEGNQAISWNQDVYVGEQFETPEGTFSGLVKEDTIKVSVIAQIEEPQYVMTYKAGAGWEWTDLEDITVEDGLMSYIVSSDEMAQWIAERGLVFRGQGYDMTKIVVASKDEEPEPQPEPLEPGEERVLWEGEETLAWTEVAEQSAAVAALLGEKDQLIVTVSAKTDAEWPKVLLRDMSSNQVGEDILLNEVSEFPYEAAFTLKEADVEALKDGFKLCGDGVTVTKLVLKKYKEEDPEPAIEYVDSIVWIGDVAISWNTEVYAGEQFDTYAAQQDMFAGLAKDDSIKVYYAEAIEGAQFAASYKAGDDWTWTDLVVSEHDGFYAYKVESDEMAELIADRGLILRGQGYHAVTIVLGKPQGTDTAIENIELNPAFEGVRFNLMGQQVNENYKGIVILNGKKYLQ